MVRSAGPAPGIEQHYRWQDDRRIVVLRRWLTIFAVIPGAQNASVAQPAVKEPETPPALLTRSPGS